MARGRSGEPRPRGDHPHRSGSRRGPAGPQLERCQSGPARPQDRRLCRDARLGRPARLVLNEQRREDMKHAFATAAAILLAGTMMTGAASAADTIKIGIPVGLSGANSVVAPSVVQAAELAVEEINAKGGILGKKLALEVADDASGAAGAQKAFDSLIFQKKVNVLISMETSA